MRIFGFPIVGVNDEFNIKAVSELNEILEKMGVTFEIKQIKDHENIGHLSILINMDTLEKKMTRNAGRKVDHNKAMAYSVNPTVAEVFTWRKTMTHQEIIEKIGCPRATYYRCLKKLSEVYSISEDKCDVNDEALDIDFFGI